MKITLDLETIGATTLKGIRRQLILELKANNAEQKSHLSLPEFKVTLRRQETQLITAISKINVALSK
jgi:hypothetical protein